MKVLATLLLVTVAVVSAQVSVQRVKPHPDYPDSCYLEEEKEAHPIGSSWALKDDCAQGTCRAQGKDLAVEYQGCGLVIPPTRPCKVVKNEKAQYPECCPKVVCPGGKS